VSFLAAAVDWSRGPTAARSVRQMLAPVEQWAPDGLAVDDLGMSALGCARLAVAPAGSVPAPGEPLTPLVSVVLDGRIDNLPELAHLAGCDPSAPAEVVLARGYERLGEAVASAVVGDFAVVVWDPAREKLVAFRDPFGVAPLVFCATAGRLFLASSERQLVALEEVPRELDENSAVDFLLGWYSSWDATSFQGIKRLRPGHTLVAERGTFRLARTFFPPPEDARLASPAVVMEECRRLLFESVRARLVSGYPVMARLSGGIDSSCVVCAAAALGAREPLPAPVTALSARYPGMPAADEGPFIRAVVEHTRLPALEWDGNKRLPRSEPGEPELQPTTALLQPDETTEEREILKRANARVLLDGLGGDQIGDFPGTMQDLGARRAWREIAGGLGRAGRSFAARQRAARDALLGALPGPVADSLRRARVALERLPPWLSPLARQIAREMGRKGAGPQLTFASRGQARLWQLATSSRLVAAVEGGRRAAASLRAEVRYPYLDRRFVDFVLRIPLEYRVRHPYRRIHREAMAADLPRLVADRETKAGFAAALVADVRRLAAPILAVLEGPRWESHRFVDQRRAAERARQVLGHGSNWRDFHDLSRVAALELWLRARV
jgi:asparagine synthase (glutamine-hydrolysing)